MGIVASCHNDTERDLFLAIGEGDLQHVRLLLISKPKLVDGSSFRSVLSPLHYAAAHGKSDALLLLLENGAMVDALNSYKQTPLMLACKNGRMACIEHLVERGANVLIFDASHERTCLHYTAKSGDTHCLQKILEAAQCPAVVQTWGFARFINVRDGSGATPLHLAARSRHSAVVRSLLRHGALVGATTTKSGRSSFAFGSTPLHLAARGGSTECVKELLAWGADRLQKNSQGHTPFFIAMKCRHMACAALLNPLTAEPLVWPSMWKFMSNLDPEAKAVLEVALAEANDAWEKRIFSTSKKFKAVANKELARQGGETEEDDDSELCCICFEHTCTIEVQDCGHQMCAGCTLALCCHTKPNPTNTITLAPVCPFCRRIIQQLKCAPPKAHAGKVEEDKQGNESLTEEYKENTFSSVNRLSKLVDNGSSSRFIGLVNKGSFKLLSSARSSSRVLGIAQDKESSLNRNNTYSSE